MFQNSIKRKIVGIAVGLIVLMVVTSTLSMLMEAKIGQLLDANDQIHPGLQSSGARKYPIP